MVSEHIQFRKLIGDEINQALLDECAELFCEHYGKWSSDLQNDALAGKSITRSGDQLKDYLSENSSWIATARTSNGVLIGYAIAARFKQQAQNISWVTQLVVHANYRHIYIASRMLNSIWGFSNDFAWGMASANPFAIRALEKATRRRCDPKLILKNKGKLKTVLSRINYLATAPLINDLSRSIVDTEFHQDISTVGEMIERASEKISWMLGKIEQGQEWLAVTFHDQTPTKWSDDELNLFMDTAADVAHEAYDRMAIGVEEHEHPWAKQSNANKETDYLWQEMNVRDGSRIIDFGCGNGRHCHAFAKKGAIVTGVDSSESWLNYAKKRNMKSRLKEKPKYILGDCRTGEFGGPYHFGICLYDVIGSFPNDEHNEQILQNLARHIVPGGRVAFSVMSFEYMKNIAKFELGSDDVQTALDNLVASSTMQSSGEIFNPDLCLIDEKNQIVYRKEIFDFDTLLPAEHVVRDRRYTFDELENICKSMGLTIVTMDYVRAGEFETLENIHEPTKEILVIAEKNLV